MVEDVVVCVGKTVPTVKVSVLSSVSREVCVDESACSHVSLCALTKTENSDSLVE